MNLLCNIFAQLDFGFGFCYYLLFLRLYTRDKPIEITIRAAAVAAFNA